MKQIYSFLISIFIILVVIVEGYFIYQKNSEQKLKNSEQKLREELKLQKKDCITLTRGAIELAEKIPSLLFLEEKDTNPEFNKFIRLRNNLENSCKKYVEPERTEPLPLLEEK